MKTMMIRLVVAHLAMASLTYAQEKDPWIGKRVFTRFGALVKVENDVVDDEGRSNSLKTSGHDRNVSQVYRVEDVNGEWLWLKDEKSGVAGWVHSKWMVPFEKAIEFYSKQIWWDPQAANYCARGNIWVEKGEFDEAIADFNEAIRIEPGEPAYWRNRGIAWSKKNDYDKAIADYNEAIRLYPSYSLAFRSRGLAWFNKNDYDRAIADYDESIRLYPNDAVSHANRGSVWYNKKEYGKAIDDYNEAIQIDRKYSYAFRCRGRAWSNKKEYDKALADFNEAIRLGPNDAYAYNLRAWLWATCADEKHRDGKRALESATKACELSEWRDAYQLSALAAAYAESGDFDKALEWQEKAHKLYSDEDRKKWGKLLDIFKDKKPYRDMD